MKRFYNILLITGMTLMFACNSGSEGQEKQEDHEQQEMSDKKGVEYTSKYICPMHCEGSGSNEPGFCPVCGMPLELNPNYKGDSDSNNTFKDSLQQYEGSHDHDHDHDHEH